MKSRVEGSRRRVSWRMTAPISYMVTILGPLLDELILMDRSWPTYPARPGEWPRFEEQFWLGGLQQYLREGSSASVAPSNVLRDTQNLESQITSYLLGELFEAVSWIDLRLPNVS